MEKNKVLLIYTNARLRNQKPRPPLSLLCLAAALKPTFEPLILDLRITPDYRETLQKTLSDCLFVGISTIIGQQLNFSLEAAKLVKRMAPDVPVVFGGVFPSMAPEIVLKEPCIDLVSIGDGEDTLVLLAKALQEGRSVSEIPGLAYRKNGKPVIHPVPCQRSLDTPVRPAWELVNISDYREVNVYTSKGCNCGCSFCYNRIFNHGHLRLRSVEHVWKEITYLHNQCGVQHISFVDDNFFADRSHAKAIMMAFRDSNWRMTWETTCRVDDLCDFDEEMLQLIHDSGCKELFVGFESASDHVLERVNKQVHAEQMWKCLDIARKWGITIRALFVIGFVGETRKELLQTLKTVDFLRKEYGDCVKIPVFGIYTPYPQMPPKLSNANAYKEPQTMQEWSEYHHDQANHQWLTRAERTRLETVIWVYRYFSKRDKFLQHGGMTNRLLYCSAWLRWKLKFFSFAPEWEKVRQRERQEYRVALDLFAEENEELSGENLFGN